MLHDGDYPDFTSYGAGQGGYGGFTTIFGGYDGSYGGLSYGSTSSLTNDYSAAVGGITEPDNFEIEINVDPHYEEPQSEPEEPQSHHEEPI